MQILQITKNISNSHQNALKYTKISLNQGKTAIFQAKSVIFKHFYRQIEAQSEVKETNTEANRGHIERV